MEEPGTSATALDTMPAVTDEQLLLIEGHRQAAGDGEYPEVKPLYDDRYRINIRSRRHSCVIVRSLFVRLDGDGPNRRVTDLTIRPHRRNALPWLPKYN